MCPYSADDPLSRLLSVAETYGLSAYDAAYLVLAIDAGARLLTREGRLSRATKQAGVSLGCGAPVGTASSGGRMPDLRDFSPIACRSLRALTRPTPGDAPAQPRLPGPAPCVGGRVEDGN